MTETPYIYQTLHVEGRKVRFLDRHIEMLKEGARRYFALDEEIDFEGIERRVAAHLDSLYYPKDRSSYVRLMVGADAVLTLEAEPSSLYRGYVLRAIRPEAEIVSFNTPFEDIPNSASRQAWHIAGAMCRGSVVVRRGVDSEILDADGGAQLFALYGRAIFTSMEPRGVEAELAAEAISRSGLKLSIEPVTEEHIQILDELFYVDYRGVTSINSCSGRRFMSGCALKVATSMEQIVSKM